MPTYQYACTECGHRFEAFQAFSDDALTECPQCDGRIRKVYGSVGVVFKGSGFYRTDSRNGNGKVPAAGSESGSSGSGSEKAPAAKSADSASSAASSSGSSASSSSSSSGSSGSSGAASSSSSSGGTSKAAS